MSEATDDNAGPQRRPNVLFVMTDQQRFDTIAALGAAGIRTPHLDRLVRRGASFTSAYSTCPVCVPARYTIRTGCEPARTGFFFNQTPKYVLDGGQVSDRCGEYLAQRMRRLGYRTFGVGKFHSEPWDEDLGYDVHLRSEETYDTPAQRDGDAFAAHVRDTLPAYGHVEQLHGERTEMYYMPQLSPLPAEHTVEAWAADRAIEQIDAGNAAGDGRPYFGFVSFIGPHPPLAPPVPFNRLYDPDQMPSPVHGDPAEDAADDFLPWMTHAVWAEGITDPLARVVRARYWGEITYIDQQLGRILDAVEARPDGDDTLICFFADHGDHLGDHGAWQKESFFDAACRIPFLLSWPGRIDADTRRDEIVCLTDLFAVATAAAGACETRDGVDVLGGVRGDAPHRDALLGVHGLPGTRSFKSMLVEDRWKYIHLANGGREQLFDRSTDPHELRNVAADEPAVASRMRGEMVRRLRAQELDAALDGDRLKSVPFEPYVRRRIYQFDRSRGIFNFGAGFDGDGGAATAEMSVVPAAD